jgi:hypothetical protein
MEHLPMAKTVESTKTKIKTGVTGVLVLARLIPHLEDVAGHLFTMIFVHAFLVVAPDLTTIKSYACNSFLDSCRI